jgi:type II secretory pathway component PulK
MEKLYPILEAARLFNIPRSVMVNAVANGAVQTTYKFETVSDRQRAKHFIAEAEALRILKLYQDGEEDRQAHIEQAETGKKWARTVDSYSHQARARLEDRILLKELEPYGVSAVDVL